MKAISMQAPLIVVGIIVIKTLLPCEVKADTQTSASTSDNKISSTIPSGFSAEHPDADFTALPGVAYFVMKPAVTCTLSTAVGADGKEILIVPTYSLSFFALRDGIAFRTTGGEHIFSYRRAAEKRMKYTLGTGFERRFISDGKNWYLIHARY